MQLEEKQYLLRKLSYPSHSHNELLYPLLKEWVNLSCVLPLKTQLHPCLRKLELAGNPGNLDPAVIFALRFLGIPFGMIFIILDSIAAPGSFMDGKGLLFGLPAAILGFYLPDLLLTIEN